MITEGLKGRDFITLRDFTKEEIDTMLDVGFLPRNTEVVNVLTRETLAIRDGRIAMSDAFRVFPGALLHFAPAARA